MEEKNTTLDDGSKEEKLHNARCGSNRYFLLMVVNIVGFILYARFIKGRKNWEKGRGIW